MPVEIFSRTCLSKCNCKRDASKLWRNLCAQVQFRPAGLSLKPARPGANRRVAASVGVQQREGIRGSRFAPHRDEDATPAGKRLENPAVVRLKSDATHRAGQPDF